MRCITFMWNVEKRAPVIIIMHAYHTTLTPTPHLTTLPTLATMRGGILNLVHQISTRVPVAC